MAGTQEARPGRVLGSAGIAHAGFRGANMALAGRCSRSPAAFKGLGLPGTERAGEISCSAFARRGGRAGAGGLGCVGQARMRLLPLGLSLLC